MVGTISILLTLGFAWHRMISNHLMHLKEELNIRFDNIDKDIRELRDWTIVMRGTKRMKAN